MLAHLVRPGSLPAFAGGMRHGSRVIPDSLDWSHRGWHACMGAVSLTKSLGRRCAHFPTRTILTSWTRLFKITAK